MAQRAAKLRGKPKSPEHRAKLAANLARAREAMAAMERAPISEETREKLAASKRGKRMSEETKKKVSDAKKAQHAAERAAGIVRSHTEETKAKQSAARRAWYERNPTFKRPRTAEGQFA